MKQHKWNLFTSKKTRARSMVRILCLSVCVDQYLWVVW